MEPDPEQVAHNERNKRIKSEEYYHEQVAERDERIAEHDKAIEELKKQFEDFKKKEKVQRDMIDTQQKMLKKQDEELKEANKQIERHKYACKQDQELLRTKDKDIQKEKQKRQEFFQEKKAAQNELAEALASNLSLHEKCDERENENAELKSQLQTALGQVAQMEDIHRLLKETFTDIHDPNLTTPELVNKVVEYEKNMKRTDSHTSMSSDGKPKKPRMSLGGELADADLESEEGSEGGDEGDETLTIAHEVAEMQQKVQDVENQLAESKAEAERTYDEVSALKRELAAEKAKAAAVEKAKGALGFSSISEVATSPISATPASPPPPPQTQQQQLGFSTISSVDTTPVSPPPSAPAPPTVVTVTAKPTARNLWDLAPGWLLFLLLLCGLALGWLWLGALRERALWLGANDVVRAGAVRLAVRRQTAYCGAPGAQFEGVLAPVWLGLGEWLGLPLPVLLT